MNNKQIAQTILSQLGGNHFASMTGANNFVAVENGLQMNIRQNLSGANKLVIKLNGKDLYDVRFVRVARAAVKVKAEFNDVFAEDLARLFEQTTGYITSLGRAA